MDKIKKQHPSHSGSCADYDATETWLRNKQNQPELADQYRLTAKYGQMTVFEIMKKLEDTEAEVNKLIVHIDTTYCKACAERNGIFDHLEEKKERRIEVMLREAQAFICDKVGSSFWLPKVQKLTFSADDVAEMLSSFSLNIIELKNNIVKSKLGKIKQALEHYGNRECHHFSHKNIQCHATDIEVAQQALKELDKL